MGLEWENRKLLQPSQVLEDSFTQLFRFVAVIAATGPERVANVLVQSSVISNTLAWKQALDSQNGWLAIWLMLITLEWDTNREQT